MGKSRDLLDLDLFIFKVRTLLNQFGFSGFSEGQASQWTDVFSMMCFTALLSEYDAMKTELRVF